MAAALVGGCGHGDRTPQGGPIVITEMDYWTTSTMGEEADRLFRAYEKTHPGVVIKRNAVPFGSLIPKAVQMGASHTLPNLLVLDNPNVASFAATGVLRPLDDLMAGAYRPSDFYAGPYQTMQYNGKVFGFPMGNNDLALYYNKKMFADAHLAPPTTWAELKDDARKLSHGDVYGFAFCAVGTEEGAWQYLPFLWENGGDIAHLDSPQAEGALQLLTDLVQSGAASKAVVNWTQNDVTTQFIQGRAAMMENGPWNLSKLDEAKVDYGVVPLPVPAPGGKSASALGGEELTITVSDPAHEKATWDLVHWMTQKENMLAFDRAAGYIPAVKTTAAELIHSDPKLAVFAAEFESARSRTAVLGVKYPQVSSAVQAAEQAALTGQQSPKDALAAAARRIAAIQR